MQQQQLEWKQQKQQRKKFNWILARNLCFNFNCHSSWSCASYRPPPLALTLSLSFSHAVCIYLCFWRFVILSLPALSPWKNCHLSIFNRHADMKDLIKFNSSWQQPSPAPTPLQLRLCLLHAELRVGVTVCVCGWVGGVCVPSISVCRRSIFDLLTFDASTLTSRFVFPS